ncbi:MAG TPA: GGDEF domain-containing protein [Thermoanaerobaculia bacterium]|nr:GGDEF domain-containing protein [Thermoanaerobaculia bacterium]
MTDSITRILSESDLPRPGRRVASLVVIYGGELGRRFPLDAELTIGRSFNNSIVIDADSVSRRHARFVPLEEDFIVEDLGSTNGTLVNGERVDRRRPLAHGDLVQIGGVVLRFISGGDVEAMYHEEIYRLTIIDGLTQVHNRRYFDDFLEREVARCSRSGGDLALVLFDIDDFKGINDSLGHLFGDRMLRTVAALVEERVRREQLFARYGGDEFALILPDVDLDDALAFAERVRELVERTPVEDRERTGQATLSLGVATLAQGMEVEDLVKAADQALYAAKEAGRNRAVAHRG